MTDMRLKLYKDDLTGRNNGIFRRTYPWGKTGLDGLAAQLAHASQSHEFKLDEQQQYAELWMGTHQNGPATLTDGTDLQRYIDQDKEYYLGKAVLAKFKGDSTLPFLFKVLTARKALQLQIHPDKTAAKKLHQENPDDFNDTNHKPEIALALTPCEIFAGFRPAEQIKRFLTVLPELKEIFGTKTIDASVSKNEKTKVIKQMLFQCFDTKDSKPTFDKIMASDSLLQFPQERGLLERCNRMYPGDSGSFIVVFLMNFFLLQPGQAVYVKEDGIHAWFTGDMIECMAVSDNVLNIGFLPEPDRQKLAFLDLVRYDDKPIKDHEIEIRRYEKSKTGKTLVYDPPIEEFSILKTDLEKGYEEQISGVDGPGIFVVVEGSADINFTKDSEQGELKASKGHVFFVAAGTALRYSALENFQVFEAISGEMMDRKGDMKT